MVGLTPHFIKKPPRDVPPERLYNYVPPERLYNYVPPERLYNYVPPERLYNCVEGGEDVKRLVFSVR
jgi:hypothetical protein